MCLLAFQYIVEINVRISLCTQQKGFDECVASLGEMIIQAKRDANIDPNLQLESLV